MSPVKFRFISSIGAICEYPPPVAPPLIPKQGPRDGSRKDKQAFLPSLVKASAKPMETVDLPSPALVGVMAVTKTREDVVGISFGRVAKVVREIFALYLP